MTDAAAGPGDHGVSARVVLMTAPDRSTARRLVRTLVEERVVACGNILPGVESIYRWQGEIEEATESLVVFKTTAAAAAELERRVAELHPYDVPEVLVLPISAGHAPYLAWVAENVRIEK